VGELRDEGVGGWVDGLVGGDSWCDSCICMCVYMYVLGSLYWEHACMGATPAIIALVRAAPPRLHV